MVNFGKGLFITVNVMLVVTLLLVYGHMLFGDVVCGQR